MSDVAAGIDPSDPHYARRLIARLNNEEYVPEPLSMPTLSIDSKSDHIMADVSGPSASPVQSGKKRKRDAKDVKAKNWMGDVFFQVEPPESDYTKLAMAFQAGVEAFPLFRGVSFQLERCPESKRLHFQWNIIFTATVSQPNLCRHIEGIIDDTGRPFLKHPNVQVTKAPEEAWDYTSKDRSRVLGPWQSGEGPQRRGARTDLKAFVREAKDVFATTGLTPSQAQEFEEKHYMIEARYPRFYEKYVSKHEPKRSIKTFVIAIHGPPNLGKTRFARWFFDHLEYEGQPYKGSYPVSKSHVPWFYGYEGQEKALFDEFTGQYSVELFKELTGDDECKVKAGNSQVERQWRPKVLVIASNTSPEEWYGPRNDVMRRINVVIKLDYDPSYPLSFGVSDTHKIEVVRHAKAAVSHCVDSPDIGQAILVAFQRFQSELPQ